MIRLDKVTKVYPDGTEAVRGVSFSVEQGELCVLLGPSGCGKTTTMKMINRLIPVTSGKIYIDGAETTSMNEDELRRNIGYAIQDVGLFPHMTVGENIATVPALKGWPRARQMERTRELLELLRMDPHEFMDKYPRELSGGQRQRVGVARALGADPPVLLMDEPFGAIDPITRVDLQNELLKIQQEIRKTIIFVTHDIYEAIKMADKIALMNEGRLVQYAPPADLLFRPKDEFVAGFVGADRALKGLQLIRTQEVMKRDAPTVNLDESVAIAKERMNQERTDWLAVIDAEERFTGWVRFSDLEKGDKVGDIVTTPFATASRNVVLSEALSLMLTSGLNLL
ncbi:MAG: betaine/proline/choline family ABC transporter ATP-binding protein, partial [Deltaproteobacteria bacterium]|nr:betaine/proline/choline family ABC transporter ATP-binding protein [Deltaproteobacteria bacterium]